jgi:hydrogenase nickel incorporation protein HypA/HybF
MHEYAIACGMAAVVEDAAAGRRVTAVQVRVGALRQVSLTALRFAWQAATTDTTLEGAELEVEQVAAAARCLDCGAQTAQERFPLVCGACGSLGVEVVAGEELLVESVEVEEEEVPCTA